MTTKLFLQLRKFVALCETFDSSDLGAVRLHREHEATARWAIIQENGAGAAGPMSATHMRTRQVKLVAEKIDQEIPALDFFGKAGAIDGYLNFIAAFSCAQDRPPPLPTLS